MPLRFQFLSIWWRGGVLWGGAVMWAAGCGSRDAAEAEPAGSSPSETSSSGSETRAMVTASLPAAGSEGEMVDAPIRQEFKTAVQARVGDTYVTVIHADGRREIVPRDSLTTGDFVWLQQLARDNPFTGRAQVRVTTARERVQRKNTIVEAKTENGVETVQLVSPRVPQDQIGATCMIYARVHLLDIAGYYVDRGTVYRIINDTPPEAPWEAPRYAQGLVEIEKGFEVDPVSHWPPPAVDRMAWAREQLRLGRPLLAAFPREIWRALPPGFLASRPWSGGAIGHQIVVNGFTFNETTGEGTFHIVNSWSELPEFDIALKELRHGELVFERSMSPIGEPQPRVAEKEVVRAVTRLRAVGDNFLFEVETNRRVHRVAAPTEAAARRMVEER